MVLPPSFVSVGTLALLGVVAAIGYFFANNVAPTHNQISKKRRIIEGKTTTEELKIMLKDMNEWSRFGNSADENEDNDLKRDAARKIFDEIPPDEKAELLWMIYMNKEKGEADFELMRSVALTQLREVISDNPKDIASSFGPENIDQLCKDLTESSGDRSNKMDIIAALIKDGLISKEKIQHFVIYVLLYDEINEDTKNWLHFDRATDENDNKLVNMSLEFTAMNIQMANTFEQQYSELIRDGDWMKRVAAIRGFAAVPGRLKTKKSAYKSIDSRIIALITDQNPRVRDEVCAAIGRILTDENREYTPKCQEEMVRLLLSLLSDPVPRVAVHSAVTISRIIQFGSRYDRKGPSIPFGEIIPAFDTLFQSIYQDCYEKRKILLLGNMIGAINEVGKFDWKTLTGCYEGMVGPMKQIFKKCEGEELVHTSDFIQSQKQFYLLSTCQSIIEWFAEMGSAVEQQRFISDVSEVIHQLAALSVSPLYEKLLCKPEFSTSLRTIAKSMGDSFGPFVPQLLPPMIDAIEAPRDSRCCGCQVIGKRCDMIENITLFAQDCKDAVAPFAPRIKEVVGKAELGPSEKEKKMALMKLLE